MRQEKKKTKKKLNLNFFIECKDKESFDVVRFNTLLFFQTVSNFNEHTAYNDMNNQRT